MDELLDHTCFGAVQQGIDRGSGELDVTRPFSADIRHKLVIRPHLRLTAHVHAIAQNARRFAEMVEPLLRKG